MSCATVHDMSNLATLLANRNLRLIDLARKLQVNKGTVTRWAQKQVPLDQLEAIEKVTGIAPCDLRPDLANVFTREPAGAAQ